MALDTRSDFAAPYITRAKHAEGRALLRPLRRRARAAHDDGRTHPGLPAALVHQAQVQLPPAHRAALPALRHRQVLGAVRGRDRPRRLRANSSPPGPGSSTATCGNCAPCCSTRCTRPRSRSTTRPPPRPATVSRPSSAPPACRTWCSTTTRTSTCSPSPATAAARRSCAFACASDASSDARVHLIDRSMDEDDAEILESVLTDIYVDAESVPAGRAGRRARTSATPLMREYLVETARSTGRGRARRSAASAAARSNSRATTR